MPTPLVRRLRPPVAILAAGVLAFGAGSMTVASAASIGGLHPRSALAGSDPVTPCDPDGVTVVPFSTAGRLTAIRVDGVADPGCSGETLTVTPLDAAGVALTMAASATVPSDADTADDTVTVAVPGLPSGLALGRVAVQITGP
jgi:hypothetical protein